MNKLMVNFIWKGRHWKHQNFVYGRLEGGGIRVHNLFTQFKTLLFCFFQNFIASYERGRAWYFPGWNIRIYRHIRHADGVLKQNLNPKRFLVMSSFYANALEAW
jgi:hypothetical protein